MLNHFLNAWGARGRRFESSHTDQTISFINAGLQLQSGSPRVFCVLLVCHLR